MIQTKKPYRWLTFEGDKGHKRVIETRQFKDELIIGIGFNSISIIPERMSRAQEKMLITLWITKKGAQFGHLFYKNQSGV